MISEPPAPPSANGNLQRPPLPACCLPPQCRVCTNPFNASTGLLWEPDFCGDSFRAVESECDPLSNFVTFVTLTPFKAILTTKRYFLSSINQTKQRDTFFKRKLIEVGCIEQSLQPPSDPWRDPQVKIDFLWTIFYRLHAVAFVFSSEKLYSMNHLCHGCRIKQKKKALNWCRYVLQADPVFQR